MGKAFTKTAGTGQRARLSVLLCLALVLGAMPGAAWAGSAGPEGGAPAAVAEGSTASEVAAPALAAAGGAATALVD